MRVTVLPDREALDRHAAAHIREAAKARPGLLICLASGDTPTGTYALLAAEPERLAHARFIQLDEWAGLGPGDAASCAAYLERTVRRPLAVPPERWIGIRGDAPDAAAECRRVAAALDEAGPIDLCILGLGLNGHLGLNEPAESFAPLCHVATLAAQSQAHPMLAGTGGAVLPRADAWPRRHPARAPGPAAGLRCRQAGAAGAARGAPGHAASCRRPSSGCTGTPSAFATRRRLAGTGLGEADP